MVYRNRINSNYYKARILAVAPDSFGDLVPRSQYLRKLFRAHFPADKSASVLDVGCGHGALIHFAHREGYTNIRGVDGSPEQVAAARQLGIEGVEEGDILEYLSAQTDESLDVVVAFDVIEHFTRDELLSLVDQVRRVLRPGGRWIIHTTNGGSPFFGYMRYGDFTHEMAFTSSSIKQLLLFSGFYRVHCYEDTPVPHGIKSVVRLLLWKLFRAFLRLYLAVETGDARREMIFSLNFLAVAEKEYSCACSAKTVV